jgi:2-dehydro-3-deoxyphosphogluconate aldolase/(4S)-4-hydroxy-2-oxoglutarate aldolase
MMHAFEVIEKLRVVPVAVIEQVESALPLAEALLEGGLNLIEVTLRTEAAFETIAAIRGNYPEMIVGAGTILDADVISRLVDLGVGFGVTPGLNKSVAEEAQRVGFPLTPGVITPTEVERARALGFKLLKFFPAETSGGVKMLKALAGPYGHTGIRFIPTGGINVDNAADYLSLPIVAGIGGSWFVDKKLINEGEFTEITRLTKKALSLAVENA